MNLINNYSKLFFTLLLMVNISNTYAQVQEATAAEGAEVSTVCNASVGCDMASAGAESTDDLTNSCDGIENCVVVAASCDDHSNAAACNSASDAGRYGGIEKEYVVKGCKVTIYNDGPVKMVTEQSDQPCDAPLPKNHKFHKAAPKVYKKGGCTITEYKSADGIVEGTKDCSKKK